VRVAGPRTRYEALQLRIEPRLAIPNGAGHGPRVSTTGCSKSLPPALRPLRQPAKPNRSAFYYLQCTQQLETRLFEQLVGNNLHVFAELSSRYRDYERAHLFTRSDSDEPLGVVFRQLIPMHKITNSSCHGPSVVIPYKTRTVLQLKSPANVFRFELNPVD
jgi:hypothetical protein